MASMSVDDFVREHGVSVMCDRVKENPRLMLSSFSGETWAHWKVVLKRRRLTRSTFTVFFSKMRSEVVPTADEVLDSLALDALVAEHPQTTQELRMELNLTPDLLIKYVESCKKRANGLKRVLGIGPFNTLLYGTRRILTRT